MQLDRLRFSPPPLPLARSALSASSFSIPTLARTFSSQACRNTACVWMQTPFTYVWKVDREVRIAA